MKSDLKGMFHVVPSEMFPTIRYIEILVSSGLRVNPGHSGQCLLPVASMFQNFQVQWGFNNWGEIDGTEARFHLIVG